MRARFIYAIIALVAAAGLFTCWCGTPLLWDGVYQLVVTLADGKPFVYETRFHSALLWWPVALLSRFTGNRTALVMTYGLPYCLAPAAGLLLSWWVVRRRAPGLMFWAILGIIIAPLPGQIFIINDSILQQHLFWPVFLGMLIPLTGVQAALLLPLAIFQLSHPIGIGLLLGAGSAGALMAWIDSEHRAGYLGRSLVLFGLMAAAAAKLVIWPDLFAIKEASWSAAGSRWVHGVAGWPISGLALVWLATLAVVIARRRNTHRSSGNAAAIVAVVSMLLAGAIWLWWASDGRLWYKALDYRRWLVPLTLPFFLGAFAEAVVQVRGGNGKANSSAGDPWPPLRLAVAGLAAATFAAVLSAQSLVWLKLNRRLEQVVATWPGEIIPPQAVQWAKDTPLDHWAVYSHVMFLQGKRPTRLLLPPQWMQRMREKPGIVPYCPWDWRSTRPGPNGWFDLRQFDQLKEAGRPFDVRPPMTTAAGSSPAVSAPTSRRP